MSLLQELAKNSCIVDYSIQELLPSVSVEYLVSEGSQKSQTKSNRSSYQLIATNVVSPTKKRFVSIHGDIEDSNWGVQSRYFEKYRDKFSKLDGLVSVLSTKIRKMNYQFMVHLERWCKQMPKNENFEESCKEVEIKSAKKKEKNRQNELIFYSNLQQIGQLIEKKRRQVITFSFGKIHRKLMCWMKIDFFIKIVENIRCNSLKINARNAFKTLFLFSQKPRNQCIKIQLAKNIKFPQNLKNSIIKTQLNPSILESDIRSQPLPPSKINFIYPQSEQHENIDFRDTMNLFMTYEEKGQDSSQKIMQNSFVNSCVSAFEGRISSSSQSYHKMLSEIQFTAVPQNTHDRRKVSDFISSGDAFSNIEKKMDNYVNPTKSEDVFENIAIQRDFKEQTIKRQNFSNVFVKKQESHERRLSSPEQIVRSRSDVKIYQFSKERLLKDEIEHDYRQEMQKYFRFKKQLQERRNSALKQIEKSQDTIRKLMVKYKKEKKKNSKFQVVLKLDNSKISKDRNSQKKGQDLSKKTINMKKYQPKRNSLKKQQKSISNSFSIKSKRDISPDFEDRDNLDIYCQYVNQKKKMSSLKATPTRKCSKGSINEEKSQKKQQKKLLPSSAQRNILALSELPLPKDQRIDLKVDLLKSDKNKTDTKKKKLTRRTKECQKPKQKWNKQ